MYQKSKFPMTFISEANCQVSQLIQCWLAIWWFGFYHFASHSCVRRAFRFLWILFKSSSMPVYLKVFKLKCSVWQILEMPYKGKELSMLIFLPKAIEDGTTGLEKVGPLFAHLTGPAGGRWALTGFTSPPAAGEVADVWELCGVDSSRHDEWSWGPGGAAPVQAGGQIQLEERPGPHGHGGCLRHGEERLLWWDASLHICL